MSVNMEDFGAKEQAEASGHKPAKKRGRPRTLTDEQKYENSLESKRKYREKEADKKQKLQENNQNLEEVIKKLEEEKEKKQSEIDTSKQALSEAKAGAVNLERKVSELSEIVKVQKTAIEGLETQVQQLQQTILNPEDDFSNIPMDNDWLNHPDNLRIFNEDSELLLNETIAMCQTVCQREGGTT